MSGCPPGEHEVSYSLTVDTSKTAANIKELNKLYTTYLSLADRAGLPEDVVEAMRKIQQLRLAIQAAHRSMLMLQAATGPLGWLTGFGGLALSGVMFADVFSVSRGY